MNTEQRSSIKKVAAASFIGTTIEWYDFFLYGTAAALVFNQLFFPDVSPTIGTLAAFATFGVGFFARPLGGVIFGHFGDKIGRKPMLILSLMIMGIATFAIGLLPTYGSIGILAPILLVLLRLFQGFGVGGEWGGAVLMAVEHAPKNRRGFYGSWPQMGVPAGLLLSTVVFAIFSGTLSDEAFLAWGWRVPFLLSIILVGVGFFIRMQVLESPAFRQVQTSRTEARAPVLEVLRNNRKNVLLVMGMRMCENGSFYVFSVFVLAYAAETLGLPRSVALNGVIAAAAIELFTVPAFGALSDRVGRLPVYLFGAIFTLFLAFPFFWLVDTESTALIWLAIILALPIGHAAMYGPQASLFSELFGTRVRYSGASLGHSLASVLAGGFAPLIAGVLLVAYGIAAVAAYVVLLSLITVVSVYFATETFQLDVSDEKSEEPS